MAFTKSEASDEFKKKQENLLSETLKKMDIVICTALIPGKKAPLIIKEEMINEMQSGSVIYDLAASQGGNSELTKADEIIDANGVKIMGDTTIHSYMIIPLAIMTAAFALFSLLIFLMKFNTEMIRIKSKGLDRL